MDGINIKFNLPVSIIKEGKQYIAYSPALDLSTCGNNASQAKKHFAQAVSLFMEELIKRGTLEQVLSDLGWQKLSKHWVPPQVVSSGTQAFCFSA